MLRVFYILKYDAIAIAQNKIHKHTFETFYHCQTQNAFDVQRNANVKSVDIIQPNHVSINKPQYLAKPSATVISLIIPYL